MYLQSERLVGVGQDVVVRGARVVTHMHAAHAGDVERVPDDLVDCECSSKVR